MSFILDALKKLEKKRQKAVVPDLTTVHASQAHQPVKKSIWAYLIVFALLLNAGILGIWLGTRDSEKQDISEQPPPLQQELASVDKIPEVAEAVKTVTPSSSEDEKKTSHEPDAEENKTPPAAETVKAESPSGSSDVSAKSISDTTVAAEATQVTNQQEADVESSTEMVTSSSYLLDEEELDDLRKKIKEEQFFEVDTAALETLKPEAPDTAIRQDVIEMSQLPSDIKKELPDLSIKTHIYSDNPSSRVVNINGNIYREGEIISKGLTLDEITETGVIFNYKDHHFHMRSF
jgi:general secretion pathway protein B